MNNRRIFLNNWCKFSKNSWDFPSSYLCNIRETEI